MKKVKSVKIKDLDKFFKGKYLNYLFVFKDKIIVVNMFNLCVCKRNY